MGRRPPCVLYQSFLVLFVFVHDAPNKGTHSPVMHLTSLEFHHSQDLREAPSLAATAYGTLFVPLQRSACDWTQVSLLLLPVMAFGADAPHRPTHRSCGSSALADGRRKVKNALYYSVVKERAEAIEKAPSLFMVKSEGAYNRNFYFSKRFLSFTLILAIRLLIAC